MFNLILQLPYKPEPCGSEMGGFGYQQDLCEFLSSFPFIKFLQICIAGSGQFDLNGNERQTTFAAYHKEQAAWDVRQKPLVPF